jgi:hypothetical protein
VLACRVRAQPRRQGGRSRFPRRHAGNLGRRLRATIGDACDARGALAIVRSEFIERLPGEPWPGGCRMYRMLDLIKHLLPLQAMGGFGASVGCGSLKGDRTMTYAALGRVRCTRTARASSRSRFWLGHSGIQVTERLHPGLRERVHREPRPPSQWADVGDAHLRAKAACTFSRWHSTLHAGQKPTRPWRSGFKP